MNLISVIIPTHNRYQMLCEALGSVLAQKDVDLEIVIVDDNSTDETSNIANQYPTVKYIRSTSNCGPGQNRRKGFNASTGDYVVFLDDDDYYIDDCFYKKAIAILHSNSSLAFVSANANFFYFPEGMIIPSYLPLEGYVDGKKYLNGFMTDYAKPLSTFPTIFRKSCLLNAGMTTMAEVNDASIYLRALTQGDVYFMKDIVGNYRQHSSNITKALDPLLIIRNMREKEYIFRKYKTCLFSPSLWYHCQIVLTNIYFMGSAPSTKNRLIVLWWIFRHSHCNPRLVIYSIKKLWARK